MKCPDAVINPKPLAPPPVPGRVDHGNMPTLPADGFEIDFEDCAVEKRADRPVIFFAR